ncbi:MAG: XdhC family protein [Acidobacteria bacterium]|nr:XdhC family protein [Acidobacteriota bacterium]
MNDLELAQDIERVYAEKSVAVLVTVIEPAPPDFIGAKILIQFPSPEHHRVVGDVFQSRLANRPSALDQVIEAARAFAQKEEARVAALLLEDELAPLRVMMELVCAEPQLIICGGGHIGQALAPLARLLDFDVAVIDDRADFASRELFPDESVHLIVKPYAEALASLKITPSTSIVIVTRGHKHDENCLRILLNSLARYIGMIGSARRVITVFRRLLDEDFPMEAIQRVHAPIGLDIGARTPAEIALSILAEVILAKYGGTGAPKRYEVKHDVHLKK